MSKEEAKEKESDDLKIVASFRGGIASVGVQRPEADPYIESLGYKDSADDLQEVLDTVPDVVLRAKEQWAENPNYPAYRRPNTSMTSTAARTATEADKEKEEEDQPTLF